MPGMFCSEKSSSIVPDPKFGLLPAEVDPVVFDLIKTATGNGITVIEPAGNNDTGTNLDAFRNGSGSSVFNRIEPTFRDSGAIIVGAASSNVAAAIREPAVLARKRLT